MTEDLDLSMLKVNPPTSAELVFADAEVGFTDNDYTVIAYGSEDLILTPSQRQGKTYAQVLEQYGPTIGMTFEPDKMTMRKESVDENEDAMIDFNELCEAGTMVLSRGSDSKGLV